MNTSTTSRPFWKRPAVVVTALILGTAGIAAAGTAWWVKHNFYAAALDPVKLSMAEREVLETKLAALNEAGVEKTPEQVEAEKQAAQELERRTLSLSEREINAFLAEQGLGEQVKVHLGNGTGSAEAIVPIEPDAPLLGGKTLRIKCAFNAKMDANQKLAFSIADISVSGVPLPNAWLGNIKGLNLFENAELNADPAVQGFLAGIRDFRIADGALRLVLNE
jgi:hypothetical protein